MSNIKFYKLTLELNSKLNKESVNLVERLQDIVEAKIKFNLISEGSKYLIILNLTQKTLNFILRLDNYVSSQPVGIKTINKFITILQNNFHRESTVNADKRRFFRVTAVKSVEFEKCRTIVDALYSDGNELINSSDLQKLFSDVEEPAKVFECREPICDNEEYLSSSLEGALEKISSMPGNTNFKKEVGSIVKFVDISKQLNSFGDMPVFPYHFVFKGEAGIDHVMPAKLMTEVFYHLGIIKNRKFTILNIPEDGNEYSGINFEGCIEVEETGVVLIEGIFDCEEGNINPNKVLGKLAEKMNQYKGKVIFIISHYNREDNDVFFKTLIDAIQTNTNYRLLEFPPLNDHELAELIESTAKKSGCSISLEAVKLIMKNVKALPGPKGFNIENSVNNIIEKAFSDKVFSLLNNNESDVSILSHLDIQDLGFLNQPQVPKNIIKNPISELDGMIGLPDVKNRVRQICNVLTVRKKKKDHGIQSNPICLHMQFTGNPGTGKTTVARIMGKIFKDLGFLSSGHFIELTRNDLIGEYIGQTTPKVKKALKRSKGGIMFIDEAYSLYQSSENDYGYEAVSELIKGMEDLKDDMVVIFAGYPKEMEKMVNMNPGLRDRIAFTIEFPDYTPDELIRIFMKMCEDNSYTLTEDALVELKSLISKLYNSRSENFGNARIIRKIFERLEIIQSSRLCEQNTFNQDDICKIDLSDILRLYEDLEMQSILKVCKKKKTIGFQQNV